MIDGEDQTYGEMVEFQSESRHRQDHLDPVQWNILTGVILVTSIWEIDLFPFVVTVSLTLVFPQVKPFSWVQMVQH